MKRDEGQTKTSLIFFKKDNDEKAQPEPRYKLGLKLIRPISVRENHLDSLGI